MNELIIKKGLKKTRVLLYDDIEQMPVERYNKVNKYWMLSDNIGSNIGDFDKNHYSKLVILADDKKKLLKQLENFRILVYNIMNDINVNDLSFACMVHSINDEEIRDFSEENLKKVLKRMSDLGLTEEVLKKKSQTQEKKSSGIWSRIFRTSSKE